MITIQNLSKEYNRQVLFDGATFTINSGERIGLVGRNGHGKTTLLRIITGQESQDSGKVDVPREYSLGYLTQDVSFSEDTVLGEACLGLPYGGDSEKWKAEKVLSGLGFSEEDFIRDPAEFSGGFQVRLNLAKVLVSDPDMLLLDEPTNFLDIVSIRWLETFLRNWGGELIIVSHDRNFMDSVTTHIIGIHRAKTRKVKGTTEDYYLQVEKEEEIYEKRRVNEEKKRKHMEDYVRRFRAKARHAGQAQSRMKSLDKMDEMDKLSKAKSLTFSFNEAPFPARVIMEVNGLDFSHDKSAPLLIKDLSFSLQKNEKICVIGKNGKGKTTLLKMLTGRLDPLAGEIKKHPQVVESYYEQANTAELNSLHTIEEEMFSEKWGITKTEVRNLCGSMMFSGDFALKQIRVLSGGEKCRVLLGKTLLHPANLILLDEPTHHLDMDATKAIIDAVSSFQGGAIVVTHDEYFLRHVATKLIVFQKDKILVYPGGYDEFLERIGWENEEGQRSGAQEQSKKGRKKTRHERAEFIALRSKTLKPYEKKIAELESSIVTLEHKFDEYNNLLIKASEQGSPQEIIRLSKSIHGDKSEMDNLYNELTKTVEEYEEKKTEFDRDG